MISQREFGFSHQDLQTSRVKRDESDVQSLVLIMERSWLDPFNPPQGELVSLSTATVAPSDVTHDLMDARKIGEKCYQTFKKERLQSDYPSVQFHDKMSKNKMKTFLI